MVTNQLGQLWIGHHLDRRPGSGHGLRPGPEGTRRTELYGEARSYDPVTGLTQFGQRYYDPSTGRWTQPDPKGGGYTYADNDPTTLTDPTGQNPQVDTYLIWLSQQSAWTFFYLENLSRIGQGACPGGALSACTAQQRAGFELAAAGEADRETGNPAAGQSTEESAARVLGLTFGGTGGLIGGAGLAEAGIAASAEAEGLVGAAVGAGLTTAGIGAAALGVYLLVKLF